MATATATTTTTTTTSSPQSGQVIFDGPVSCCGAPLAWWRHTKYRITTQYIEVEQGLCCTSISNVQLIRVKDLQLKSGACCCGSCSTITIFSTDSTDPELNLKGISNAEDVYHRIRDAVSGLQQGTRIEIQQ